MQISTRISKETKILSHSVDKMNLHAVVLYSPFGLSFFSLKVKVTSGLRSIFLIFALFFQIDRCADIIGQLHRSKTYQLLSNAIQSQVGLLIDVSWLCAYNIPAKTKIILRFVQTVTSNVQDKR